MTRDQLEHAHDLAASKLAAYREKDRDFARTLLAERLIDPQILIERISAMPVEPELSARMREWVRLTAEGIDE